MKMFLRVQTLRNKRNYDRSLLIVTIFAFQVWHWRLYDYLKLGSPPLFRGGDYLWFVGALERSLVNVSHGIGLDPRQQPETALSIQLPIVIFHLLFKITIWKASNLLLFVAPIITAQLCYSAFKEKFSRQKALLGSAIFALTPFSLNSYSHALLTILWAIPLSYIVINNIQNLNRLSWKLLIGLVVIATSSLYYVVFSLIIFLISAVISKRYKDYSIIVGIVLGVAVTTQLGYLYLLPRASNLFHVPTRYPTDSITYGGTPLTLFSGLNSKMQEFLNQVSGENHSLGLFGGTLVLISLIILTLYISRQKKTEQENSNHDEKIMLGLFLFFIKGGFGAICALAFYELTSYPSPIRVWSRLSPWLLFYALTIIFQKISFRRKATNNIWLLTLTIMLIATSLSRIPQDYWSIEKKSFVSRNLEVQEMSRQGVQKCVVLQLPIDTLPPTSAPSNIASNSDDYYYSGLQGLLVANSFVWSEGSYPGSLSYTKFIHQIYEKNRLQLSLQGLKAGNVCAIEVDSLKSKYLNLPAIPLEYKKVWSDSRYSLFMESQK